MNENQSVAEVNSIESKKEKIAKYHRDRRAAIKAGEWIVRKRPRTAAEVFSDHMMAQEIAVPAELAKSVPGAN